MLYRRGLHILLCLFSIEMLAAGEVSLAQDSPGDEMSTSYPSWDSLPDSMREAFESDYAEGPTDSVLQRYFDSVGPVAMLDFLEARWDRCHSQAHPLGFAIYKNLHDLGESLSVCGDRCTNACMHGVIRAAFGSHSFKDVESQATQICKIEEMKNAARPGACPHAMGHALLMTSDYDVKEALSGCKAFTGRFDEYRCATGVFMEYRSMPLYVRDRYEGNPWTYDCDSDPRYSVACYRYTIDVYLNLGKLDWGEDVKLCLAREGQARLGCFHGLGIRYAGQVWHDPSAMSHFCRDGTTDDQLMCMEAIVENFSINDDEKAVETCQYVQPDLKADCLEAAEGGYYRVHKKTLGLYLPE
ncbi:MAG: hypothetical protein WBW88_05840 [Rhodothermales bacterium]